VKRLTIALFAVTGLSVGLSQIASAADLPVKAPLYKATPEAVYNWTGFYVGGNAGWAWGNSSATSVFTCPTPVCSRSIAANLAAFGAGATGSSSPNGFTGGLQAGYNWQAGSAVYGLETDFNAFP